jgi:hypothetical protein
MTPERKGALIRGFFSFGLLAAAVVAALWVMFPNIGFGRKQATTPSATQEANPSNIDAIKAQKNCVVVIHCHKAGNPDSEKTKEILAELQRDKYGGEVRCAELDVRKYPALAATEGASEQNAPQLAFYVQNQRVGDYRGPWNKPDVERKIDEILNGYLQRIGKGWLPKVQGMERDRGQEILPLLPAEPRPKP